MNDELIFACGLYDPSKEVMEPQVKRKEYELRDHRCGCPKATAHVFCDKHFLAVKRTHETNQNES